MINWTQTLQHRTMHNQDASGLEQYTPELDRLICDGARFAAQAGGIGDREVGCRSGLYRLKIVTVVPS